MSKYAPIIVFAYKRLDTLKKTILSLQDCELASDCDLIVFSDGPKGEKDVKNVLDVREYLNELKGFKSVKNIFASSNNGLANSIINGVTVIFKQYDRVIVVEDDLQVSKNFLLFMNDALSYYELELKIISISGYSIPLEFKKTCNFDIYFMPRISSWGWATWRNKWEGIDWQVKEYKSFLKNNSEVERFKIGGSDVLKMLDRQMKGEIDSWAIRWYFHQIKTKSFTVYPCISKVKNIGFSNLSTNTNVFNRYETKLDIENKNNFIFSNEIIVEPYLLKQFQLFFSFRKRVFYKFKTYLYLVGLIQNK